MPDDLDVPSDIRDLLNLDWNTGPGSPLASDPEHGGVTSESLDEFMRNALAQGRSPLGPLQTSGGGFVQGQVVDPSTPVTEPGPEELEEEGEGGGDGGVTPPPEQAPTSEPTSEPSPEPSPSDLVTINGRTFTRDQLEAFARFSDSLDSDPSLQHLLTSYYTGRLDALQPPGPQTSPPPPSSLSAPDLSSPEAPALTFDETDDPRLAQMYAVIRQQQSQLAQLSQATQTVAQQSVIRSAQEAEALMNRAARSFQDQHSLSDEDIDRLRRSAGRLRVLEPLMSGIDPITNAPVRPDLLSATERALEIAMYADPTLRQRQIDAAMTQQRERNRKRQKLAGVGGGGGSVSRVPTAPRPGTPDARRAMVEEVGQMLNGTWADR